MILTWPAASGDLGIKRLANEPLALTAMNPLLELIDVAVDDEWRANGPELVGIEGKIRRHGSRL